MSTSVLLQADGISKRFGGLQAVLDVNLSVMQGEVVGLIGPNGAGKTTLFNMLAGSMPPSAGRLWFGGKDCTGASAHHMAQQGMARTFQITSVFPGLSVWDNVIAATHRHQRTDWLSAVCRTRTYRHEQAQMAQFATQALQQAGLWHRRHDLSSELPYGEQRQLEIAIGLATSPRLLLLDEPAAGMNPEEAGQLVQLIQQLRDQGMSVLLVEHHMRVVMGACDRVVVLNSGEKIAEGTPTEVVSNPEVVRIYLGRETVHA
jgi:branched-chain amino acid transport system ATP-binding protein